MTVSGEEALDGVARDPLLPLLTKTEDLIEWGENFRHKMMEQRRELWDTIMKIRAGEISLVDPKGSTTYTPTVDVNLATKKYVDDNSGGGTFKSLVCSLSTNAQTVAAGLAVVALTRELVDINNDFDSAGTSKFTAPLDGIYYATFFSEVNFTGAVSTTCQFIFYDSGALVCEGFARNDADQASICNFSMSALFNLTAGDTIYVSVLKFGADTVTIGDVAQTGLTIFGPFPT